MFGLGISAWPFNNYLPVITGHQPRPSFLGLHADHGRTSNNNNNINNKTQTSKQKREGGGDFTGQYKIVSVYILSGGIIKSTQDAISLTRQ